VYGKVQIRKNLKLKKRKQIRQLRFYLVVIFTLLFALSCLKTSYAEDKKDDFGFSEGKIEISVPIDGFLSKTIAIKNYRNYGATLFFGIDDKDKNFVKLDTDKLILSPFGLGYLNVSFYGDGEKKTYEFEIKIKGDLLDSIPVKMTITSSKNTPVELLYLEEWPIEKTVDFGANLSYFAPRKFNLLRRES